MSKQAERWHIVYDSRAVDDVDGATVMEARMPPGTRRQAIRAARTHGQCVVYSYDEDAAGALVDERLEWTDPRLMASAPPKGGE